MAHLFNGLRPYTVLGVPIRCKHGPNHWSVLRKKKFPRHKALEHFDDFYKSVYGKKWESMREALLVKKFKCMALVNNFSDTERIRSELELQGALNFKAIYNVYKEQAKQQQRPKKNKNAKEHVDVDERISSAASNIDRSTVQSVYPKGYEPALNLRASQDQEDDVEETDKSPQAVPLKSIEEDRDEISIDMSRIVDPSVTSSALYEYVPATKIKGMDDWILESDYYRHYEKGADFKVNVEKETVLQIPEHLHVYTFEENNDTHFPSPRIGSTGVLDYLLCDGASILPILALNLQPNDTVLDMCAAPGGKTIMMLQTLTPRLIVANEIMGSKVNAINEMLKQYLAELGDWERTLFLTENDARYIQDVDVYNKILVDVPNMADRYVLHNDEDNIFKPTRIRERLSLPELQTEILTNALKLIKPGGTVVYVTSSLSPVQNDGVVQMALKNTWEQTDSVMVVKDMADALYPLGYLYRFGYNYVKYGHMVIPTLRNNWGPLYFSKIVRVR